MKRERESHSNDMVRRESLSLLMREEERHSVFVENRMIDGCVDYTFDFQYIVYQCQAKYIPNYSLLYLQWD